MSFPSRRYTSRSSSNSSNGNVAQSHVQSTALRKACGHRPSTICSLLTLLHPTHGHRLLAVPAALEKILRAIENIVRATKGNVYAPTRRKGMMREPHGRGGSKRMTRRAPSRMRCVPTAIGRRCKQGGVEGGGLLQQGIHSLRKAAGSHRRGGHVACIASSRNVPLSSWSPACPGTLPSLMRRGIGGMRPEDGKDETRIQ